MEKIKNLFYYLYNLNNFNYSGFDVIKKIDGKEEEEFRVYHENCHCVDVIKKYDEEEETFVYEYYSDLFEGFKPISIDEFCNLIGLK